VLCINRCIAGALARAGGRVKYGKQKYTDNPEKYREQSKQYRKENAEKIKQYRKENAEKFKQYHKKHAEKYREQKKQYRKENAEKIKQYQQKNATKIAARTKVKHDCGICGGKYTHTNKIHHIRTQMHQRAMQSDSQAVTHHDSQTGHFPVGVCASTHSPTQYTQK
jgi:phosphotransacetylase